jgi:cation diffusion facilitator CzcD-associated flavoprotein CzcO
VLIVGAGLSGISAGHYMQTSCPRKTFAILEARETLGGTWDLFRYPGIRSDSDMYTLGYSFLPWPNPKSIADGPSIASYIGDTAREFGIDRKIRFGQRAMCASWSSSDALWTLKVEAGTQKTAVTYTCSFLFMCSGYYEYAEGYTPDWAGLARYGGRLVHPQHWPEDLDYAGRRVVIIGSGATAVTLAPAMAQNAAHVTILQRSPTYVISLPSEDPIARWLRPRLPQKVFGTLLRWRWVLSSMAFYQISRRRPDFVKRLILKGVRAHLGPDYDVATHFTPSYNPWDQRLCLVPDADLFTAVRSGRVSVETDQIENFTETGIHLRSGKDLEADIVVTATGLKVGLMGGMRIVVDGATVDLGKTLNYNGMMLSDVPNLALATGYTNASWTLKCELTAKYVCRVLNYMDANGYAYCAPRRDPTIIEAPMLPLASGYVKRAEGILPKQGSRKPWRLYQNYLLDLAALRFGKVTNPAMEFTKRNGKPGHAATPPEAQHSLTR